MNARGESAAYRSGLLGSLGPLRPKTKREKSQDRNLGRLHGEFAHSQSRGSEQFRIVN
jgi:hypothetical protein